MSLKTGSRNRSKDLFLNYFFYTNILKRQFLSVGIFYNLLE